MEGGVDLSSSPNSNNENNVFFDILDVLCQRYMGLTPFMVLNTPMQEVMDLYVDCIIHDKQEKKMSNKEAKWVTSKEATWH